MVRPAPAGEPPAPVAVTAPVHEPGAPLRYGAAAVLTAVALALSLAVHGWIGPNVFIFFIVAVILAAWHGGLGPALLVAAAAIPLVSWFLLPPYRAWSFAPGDLLRFAAFAGVALLVASMRESLQRARRQAEAHAREVQEAAVQLQEQAAELEVQSAELQSQAAELEQQYEESQVLAEEAEALAVELEEANRRLRESMEEQLAEAQRLARLGSWEWDAATGRVAWSDEMYRLYGYEPGAVPVTFQTFLERVHPGDRERVRQAVEAAFREGGAFDFYHRAVRADGAVRVMHALGTVVTDGGAPARMRGTGQDVTELRQAEETARRLAAEQAGRAEAEAGRARLEQILEGVGDAFVALDREGRYSYVNRQAEATLGLPREALLGRVVWEMFPGAVGDPSYQAFQRVLRTGASESVEFFSAALGRWLAVRVSPWDGGVAVFYEDITERRRGEEQLARLAAIVESSDDAILGKTLEGVIETWNAGAERLYGYAAAEVVGRHVSLLAPPERAGEADAILERIVRGEAVSAFETVRVRRDGTRVDVLLTVSPVRDAGGRLVGASTIARDITGRKRTEEALRFLAEASRVLASSLDPRETLAAVTRLAVPRLADYAALHLVDGDGQARPVAVAAADAGKEELLRELARRYPPRPGSPTPASRALATGEPVLVDEVSAAELAAVVDDEGDRARAEDALHMRACLAVPLHADGRVRGVLTLVGSEPGRRYGPEDLALAEELARRMATALENARLHQAEQRARRAAERSAGRIARLQAVTAALSEARTPAEVADAVLGEGFASLGAAAGWLHELAPAGDALELLRARGYPAEVEERFRRIPLDMPLPLADAVRTGEPVFQSSPDERARVYPDLQRDYARLSFQAWAAVPLVVEGRAIGGIGLSFARACEFDAGTRGFMTAIARQAAVALERTRLFEAERAARAEAEAANRAKFDFLTTMSHELRTPLNAIAGYVELLEMGIRGPVSPQQLEDLARIRRSQQHLLGLINDVLNFARVETGHVHFDIADVPLDETLAEIEALILPQVQRKGLRYEYCRFDPAVRVRADREKLQQVVLNLLSNAVKFTAAGGGIRMECEVWDGTVAVRVRDTGMGIPRDKLATVFEPFVQVNAGYTRPSEGTGLGLAISRDLARAMGGDLTAESREGEGSVFTFTLPRSVESA